MRFRAVVTSPGTFLQIVQSISRLAKRCILHFDTDKAALICADETEGGVQVWSQIAKDSLFGSYRIESNQPQSSIHLSLAVGPLLAVLRSAVAHEAKGEIVLKLAKRPAGGLGGGQEDKVLRPMLVWEIGGDSRTGRPPPLAHELPIRVLKPPEVAALIEPLCPDPDIHILLPPLSLLRTIARHLEPLASHVAVSAAASGNGLGTFRLVAGRGEGKGVEVATEWKGLKVPKVADAPEPDSSDALDLPASAAGNRFFTTHVALRSLLRFLTAHTLVGSTIACVCAGHSLILYLYIGDVDRAGGVLTFFLPAVVVEDEDE